MKSINQYLSDKFIKLDGHCGVFSYSDNLIPKRPCVGMVDIEFEKMDNFHIINAYDKYIPKLKNVEYLMCCGKDFDEIQQVFDKYSDKLAGFGELKLYDFYDLKLSDGGIKRIPVDMKHINFAERVCELSMSVGSMPVYIHYEINNQGEAKKFEELIIKYPNLPIVFCHCGMVRGIKNSMFAFDFCCHLCKYRNVYFDISWFASEFFAAYPYLLTKLPEDRIIWGSDVTPRYVQVRDHPNKSLTCHPYTNLSKFYQYCLRSDNNIEQLFKNSPKFAF